MWYCMSVPTPPLSELVSEPVEFPAIVSDTPDGDLGKVGAKGRFPATRWTSGSPSSAPASSAGRRETQLWWKSLYMPMSSLLKH